MKVLLNILLLTMVSVTFAQAGGDPVKKFYRKHKKQDQVFNLVLPGVLTRTCVGIARIFTRDEEAKAGLKLAKKMKGIRIMVDNGEQVTKAEAKALIGDLLRRNNMEILTAIRGKEEQTWVLGHIKGDKVKKIVVISFSEGQFTMVAAKSRMKIKHVNQLIKELQRRQERDQQKREAEEGAPRA